LGVCPFQSKEFYSVKGIYFKGIEEANIVLKKIKKAWDDKTSNMCLLGIDGIHVKKLFKLGTKTFTVTPADEAEGMAVH
jgi:hypothetical protein